MDNQMDPPAQDPQPVDPASVPAPEQAATAPDSAIPTDTPAEPAAPDAAPQSSSPAQSGKPRRVLLVEDDDNLANVYMQRFEAEGFNVKRVPNGEEALAVALEFRPELIILDAMMPKVSGFDVLDILRNTPDIANVRVIMLTALSQDADKERAKSLGVDDYLVKSQVVIADVVARVKFHLGM